MLLKKYRDVIMQSSELGDVSLSIYSHPKNSCQKIYPARSMKTKHGFILRGSYFCEKYNNNPRQIIRRIVFNTIQETMCTEELKLLLQLIRPTSTLLNIDHDSQVVSCGSDDVIDHVTLLYDQTTYYCCLDHVITDDLVF